MVRRIIKVARELNVGKSTIVDHLKNKGFEVEDKPNAKLTEEMYEELLREFANSMSIKEKADSLKIGQRSGQDPAKPKNRRPDFPAPKEPPPLPSQLKKEPDPPAEEKADKPEKPPLPPKPETAEEKPAEIEAKTTEKESPAEKEADKDKPGLKVVGKIELDKPKKSKKSADKKQEEKDKKAEKAQEAPADKEEQPKATPEKEEKEDKKKKSKAKPEKKEAPSPAAASSESKKENAGDKATDSEAETETGHIEKDVPKLKGLKILGKIDTQKFESDKKKSKDKDDKDSEGKKRRRRRKRKVAARTPGGRDRGRKRGARGKKEEVKEVSQKEIDEQIKATLARLSGGKKSKRPKLRKENRERLREKEEVESTEEETKKLQVTEFISVSELASLMDVSSTDVITNCMNLGVIVSINQRLDAEIIELVAQDFGYETEFISAEEQIDEEVEVEDDPKELEPRAPIVTVMG
ncbi:MAG: translation initiation factor IF-2, partial [Saprospirales bacterium]